MRVCVCACLSRCVSVCLSTSHTRMQEAHRVPGAMLQFNTLESFKQADRAALLAQVLGSRAPSTAHVGRTSPPSLTCAAGWPASLGGHLLRCCPGGPQQAVQVHGARAR